MPIQIAKLKRFHSDYEHAKKTLQKEIHNLEELQQNQKDAAEAQEYIQKLVQKIQTEIHQKIATIVSQCLSAVFDEPYTFVIEFDRKRGKTEARLEFERDGQRIDPMTSSGGGVVDVAAFALRLSRLLLSKSRRLLVLDEPFRFVSKEYAGRVRDLLVKLSEDLDIQIIQVTHQPRLTAGLVYNIGDGSSFHIDEGVEE